MVSAARLEDLDQVFRRTRASALIRRGLPAGRCGVIPVYRDWELVDRCPILSSRT